MTEEQYLALERSAETKNEFHDGQMFAMAGGSPVHALLANSMGAILRGSVSQGCRTFNSDLRIRIPSAGVYTYADCTVVCGPLKYYGEQRDVILNPVLIAEVLSPSTEAYDRGKKFELYRTIPDFHEYLLVQQERMFVEHYSRQEDGSWLLREYSGEDATVVVGSLNIRIALADLYAGAESAG